MFKFMKQGVSLAAAVVTAGSCIPVYAAGIQPRTSVTAPDGTEDKGTSITIDGAVEGHRYKVYQVFKGRVSSDGTKLSNVEYGANYSGREGVALKDELAQLEAEDAEAKAFAETVRDLLKGEPAAVLSTENPTAELEAGYYMILDETLYEVDGDSLSDYIVTVAGNVTVQPKSTGVPEFDKSIDDGKSQENTEKTHSISIEDTESGHSCEIYQIFTGTAGSGGEIENLRYGTNYGTRGDAVPSDIISSIGTPDFEEHIKQELSGSPAAVLASGDPAMDVEAGYYLAVDKDEDGNETGNEFAAVSKDKVITINHAAQAVDLSPETADIDWNYTLHEDTGVITLNYYIGTKTDVKVYSHYKVPDSDRVWKAELASYGKSGSKYMFDQRKDITFVTFSDSLDTSSCTDMRSMFDGCSALKNIDFGSNFNTSSVINMNCMFDFCSSLTSLDLSKFDTSKVTGMNNMFDGCSSLTSLDLSGFDTSNVTGMNDMFYYCSSLTSLDLSGFDTSNVTSMNCMFASCKKLSSLDLSSFHTGKVTSMEFMFQDCTNVTSLDLSNFNTQNVTSMKGMFEGCYFLPKIILDNFNTGNVTDMRNMFKGCRYITSLDLSNFDTQNVTSMMSMFEGCLRLTNVNLLNFNTSNVIDMSKMFSACGLSSIDLSSFYTINVTDMEDMFRNCSKLVSIYVTDGKWITNQADTTNMFYGCKTSAVTPVTQSASAASALFPLSYASDNAGDVQPEEFIEIEYDDTSVEYGIGDSIPYKLTATMPESITAYNKYVLAFHDKLSAGLDYDRDSLKVFAGDTEIPAEHYTVTYSEDGKSMTVSIADVKAAPWNAVPGTQIIVKYSAMLNENAQAGNTNEAFLEYSNDPKGDGTGTTGPGVPDIVTVYTFELRFDKVDKNGNALEGAGFTLYKKNDVGEFVPAGDEIKGLTRFSFKGLAAGEYKLAETTTPDGYNTMEDLYFNIVAEEAESGGETVKRISIEAPDGSPLSGWTAIGADKAFESDIANYTGSTLPETGGAGTYLLYAAGVAVVITAGTVIAARKKADDE